MGIIQVVKEQIGLNQGQKDHKQSFKRNVLVRKKKTDHFMHVGQLPKDLESRESNVLCVRALKKQTCLEKCMKHKPFDHATC